MWKGQTMNKKYCANCKTETEFKNGVCQKCSYQQFVNGWNINLM